MLHQNRNKNRRTFRLLLSWCHTSANYHHFRDHSPSKWFLPKRWHGEFFPSQQYSKSNVTWTLQMLIPAPLTENQGAENLGQDTETEPNRKIRATFTVFNHCFQNLRWCISVFSENCLLRSTLHRHRYAMPPGESLDCLLSVQPSRADESAADSLEQRSACMFII